MRFEEKIFIFYFCAKVLFIFIVLYGILRVRCKYRKFYLLA
jgi:hypothetical protein